MQAKIVEEQISVPAVTKNMYGKASEQNIVVTLFYNDAAAKPYPVATIGHGRSVDAADRASMGRARFSANATWFARLGFMAAVPTRIGYGVSGGDDVEDSGDCSRKNYPPAYAASADQTLQVLKYLRQRPDVSPDKAIVLGVSFGGTDAIAVAARNPDGIQAAINFAGGGGGNPVAKPQQPCAVSSLERLFGNYGKTARIPTLWIYSENDQFFGPKYPKEWFDAFKSNGGVGEFMLYPPFGTDGHALFTGSPQTWRPRVFEFIKANGYPNITLPAMPAQRPAQSAGAMPEPKAAELPATKP